MTNKYLIIIIVLLLSLVGAVTRIVSLQGKLYEAEMARTQMEQERIKLSQKNEEDFFKHEPWGHVEIKGDLYEIQ